jgi:threonylcarbamoyladenosine tRNA methylthiotransferase MtaB
MKSSNTKKASLHTLGCRLNQSESTLIQEQLEATGYTIVPFGEPADLAIVNTCTVTNDADTKSRKAIRGFIRKNPEAFVAVIGCYSQMGYKTLSEIEGVDLIIGNQEKMNVVDYVTAEKRDTPLVIRDQFLRDDFTIESSGASPFSRRANLKIQDGCDFMCTFCIIPFARGRARSRAMDNLLDDARQLVERGAKELVLTGVNIATYNYENQSVLDVVDKLNDIEGVERIRISSIEPTTIPVELFDRMNDPAHALVPYLHIPLQSGSNHVLELMSRRYTREEFIDFIQLAHGTVPGICIGTDVLVGSPGETLEDFEATCDLLINQPIHYAHVFKYSQRAGTAAIKIPGKVDGTEKNRRSSVVRQISGRKLDAFHLEHVGKPAEILFETEEDGLWSGYTGNYIRVSSVSSDILTNQIRPVTLERSCGDFMTGTVISNNVVEVQ